MSQLNHVLRQAAAGVDLQAVRLRRGAGYRGRRRAAHPDRPAPWSGRADHLLVRRQAVRAQQLRAEILRRRHAADGARAFAERRHREGGGDGGLRRGGGDGQPRRHELQDPADAGGGAGRLRNHAAGSRGRVHDFRQRRRLPEAQFPRHGARRRMARWSSRTRWRRSRCSIRGWPT